MSEGIPSTVIIDLNGVVQAYHVGFGDDYEEMIWQLRNRGAPRGRVPHRAGQRAGPSLYEPPEGLEHGPQPLGLSLTPRHPHPRAIPGASASSPP